MRQICLVTELFSVLMLILEEGMASKLYFAGLGNQWISTVFQLVENLVCPLLTLHTVAFSSASNNMGQLYIYFRLFPSEPSIYLSCIRAR